MSMEITTVVEFLQVLFVYLTCFFLIPHLVLSKHLKGKKLFERFLLCVILSNFYVINIVFVIFLLHLPSNRIMFTFLSVFPAAVAWQRINRPDIRKFFSLISVSFSRLMLGEAKIRTIWGSLSAKPRLMTRRLIRSVFLHFRLHIVEWLIYLALMGFNIWYHSYGTLHKYIYGTSDLIVHHSWIHQMDDGTIFSNGIYPFGFHNIVFFMHRIFHLRIVSILRTLGTVQMIFIFSMIYIILRKICHSRIIPLMGLFFFTIPDFYNFQGTMRYQWALPQEYAMLFLYPCAFFLIQYFERKRNEINTEKKMMEKGTLYAWLPQYQLRSSTRSLIFFGISFSMTLAVHFYITIIAVLLCLAIAIAYIPVVFHYRYFFSIALAGILSVSVAVLPLFIGFAEGHPLEGSLRWAMSVMSPGQTSDDSEEEEETNETSSTETEQASKTGKENTKGARSANVDPAGNPSSNQAGTAAAQREPSIQQILQKKYDQFQQILQKKFDQLKRFIIKLPKRIQDKLDQYNTVGVAYLGSTFNDSDLIEAFLWMMDIIVFAGILTGLISRKFYCRNMIAMGLYFFFMTLLVCGTYYSLPTIMDSARARLFICYATPVMLACAADFLYTVVFRAIRYHVTTEIAPILLMGFLLVSFLSNDMIKPLNIIYSLQASGEMYCDYKIMQEYPKKKWTLITTTNSIQIVSDDGWVTETCEFLGKMEKLTKNTKVTIPSKYVFFYIEKKPLVYGDYNFVTEELVNFGYVSEEEAAKDAAFQGGGVYGGENRYVLESKYYYWAKAFEEKYPREFQVYYEDDNFICYRIIQNEFHLYNFAIDYGYNKTAS